MIIAITSTDNNLEGTIDSRFGRCSFFAFYDTESSTTEFMVNPNKDCDEGPDLPQYSLLHPMT